ncbi:MAG: SDR family oxidoreductase [Luteolibacter sp.]
MGLYSQLVGSKDCGVERAIITGGTGGLGSAMADCLKTGAWEVVQLGRKDLDLSDHSALAAFFSSEKCDLLVCAAGMIRDQPLSRMEEDAWDEVFLVNFTAARDCARAAISQMVERGRGHIIFISSYAAVHPAIGQAAYATAKAALHGLTKGLAEEHGRNGIRVNAVLPGFLETPMTAAVSEKRREIVRNLHFLGELNTPESAAEFIRFLHERMPHTSGQVFSLDSRP